MTIFARQQYNVLSKEAWAAIHTKNKNLFLRVLDARKPKMKVLPDPIFDKGPPTGSQIASSTSSHGTRSKAAFWALITVRTLIAFMTAVF